MRILEIFSALGIGMVFLGTALLLLAMVGRLGRSTWKDDSFKVVLNRSPNLVPFWLAIRYQRQVLSVLIVGIALQGPIALVNLLG